MSDKVPQCHVCGRAESTYNGLTIDFGHEDEFGYAAYVCYLCKSPAFTSGGFQCPDSGWYVTFEVTEDEQLVFEMDEDIDDADADEEWVQHTREWVERANRRVRNRTFDTYRKLYEVADELGLQADDLY